MAKKKDRRTRPWLWIILMLLGLPVLVAAGGLFFLLWLFGLPPSPSTAQLEQNFTENHIALNSLASMLQREPGVIRLLPPSWPEAKDSKKVGMPVRRIALCNQLMQSAGINEGYVRTDNELLFLTYWGCILPNDAHVKGYAYCLKPPPQPRSSAISEDAPRFHHLSGNWYILEGYLSKN